MRKVIKKQNSEQEKQPQGMCQQNFKIYLRIKPVVTQDGNSHVLKIVNSNKVQITSPYYSVNQIDKTYTYQEVFDDSVNNSKVFHQTMITPITNALQGFNSTVFIYGMTGSGKTYTMFGSLGSGTNRGLQEEDGLVSMTIDYMFNEIQKQPHIQSQILVSFYQIYNENIRDLLQEDSQPLTIMQDPIRGVFINGLAQVLADEKNRIKDVIYSGIEKRSMNATRSNEVSSRSHAILQFVVKRYFNSNENQPMVLESKFFMIDLAGNEKTSNNQSRRFIEGVNINKSLLTLGKCLSILAEKNSGYVPFRDSKLTRILKQSLGGNSKTVMIACVSSERRFYEQTLNTLKYSTIAKKIKNKGVKNNLKVISKEEIPDFRNFVNGKSQSQRHSGEVQKRIKSILQTFLAAVESKLKIEKLQQDLELSRKQNEQLLNTEESDHEICRHNIKKINETLQLLIRPYEKQLEKVESSYHELMKSVNQMIKQKRTETPSANDSTVQISRLKEVIASQNKKIIEFQHKMSSYSDICVVEPENQQFQKVANKSLEYHHEVKLASPILQKQNSVPILATVNQIHTLQRNPSKGKKLTIKCNQNEQSARCSPMKTLNTSNLSNSINRFEKKSSKFQKEIVINLNTEGVDKKSQQSSKDEFVRRLKETQKKAKGVQSEEISSLLKQHQTKHYELGSAEMSMIRKLRFFQREKSLEKSSSLGKILPTKTHDLGRFNFKKY